MTCPKQWQRNFIVYRSKKGDRNVIEIKGLRKRTVKFLKNLV